MLSWLLALSPFGVMAVSMWWASSRGWPFHWVIGFPALITFPYILIAATINAYMRANGYW